MRYLLINIPPGHSSPTLAAEHGPPISTTTHKVGISPQHFVPGRGGAWGQGALVFKARVPNAQTEPSEAEAPGSVMLRPV